MLYLIVGALVFAPIDLRVMRTLEEKRQGLPVYRLEEDAALAFRIQKWLDNEAAALALRLYTDAWDRSELREEGLIPFFIALEEGGNHASSGFVLETSDGDEVWESFPFIKLDERPEIFQRTLIHEVGHMILRLLGAPRGYEAGGYVLHTTPTITDRWTAFNEGFATHFETLFAERTNQTSLRAEYDDRVARFGPKGPHFLAPLKDLSTISQEAQRFRGVRENRFAHPAAYQGDDLLRHAIAPERDFARLRNASQLLASEGFVATVFYRLVTTTGDEGLETLQYDPILDALATIFEERSGAEDHQWLVHFIEALSEEREDAIEVFVGASRGATYSPALLDLWPRLHRAALHVDLQEYQRLSLQATQMLQGWIQELEDNPSTLGHRVGPEVWVKVKDVHIRRQYFEMSIPLSFDLNAADRAEFRFLDSDSPWISEVLQMRRTRPFASLEDFLTRADVNLSVRDKLTPLSF